MTPLDTREAFDDACDTARKAAKAYYDSAELVMSDAEYDALISAIEDAAAVHGWDHGGLLDQVAAGVSTGGDVTHSTPMGSLEKAKDLDAIVKFCREVGGPVLVEPKLDGLAVRAEYRAGQLILVATRGDGSTGEDVTAQARDIAGLPTRLARTLDLEVRGEVYMTEKDFAESNTNRVASGKPAFANPRNAVAGSLRNTDREYQVAMTFAAYGAQPDETLASRHSDAVRELAALGVATAGALWPQEPLTDPADVVSALERLGNERPSLGFPTDGAVVKADEHADRARLGSGTRAPKWAVAYKYAPAEATSVLRNIEVSVGRTGRISLRGVIDPVAVDGTTITYATLHNPAFVTEQGLGIGSRVMVVRAGDVIPRITAAVGEQDANVTPWQAPHSCPQCGEAWNTESLLWRCETPACSTLARLTYAVARDALDVDGMSEAIAAALVDAGTVTNLADLLTLDTATLSETTLGVTATGKPRKIGPTVAAKLSAQLSEAHGRPLARVITALGIRGTGRTISRRLASHFGSLDALRHADTDALAEVPGIGSEKAALIRAGLDDLSDVIERLLALGLGQSENTGSTGDQPLKGMTVVVSGAMTGVLAGRSRNEMNELIDSLGGRASSSVSAQTTYLVSSDTSTSKADKARQLGVRILTPEEFAELIGM